jgi:hypothetical protein
MSTSFLGRSGTTSSASPTQFVEALRSGRRDYDPVTLEDPSARVYDEAGIITAWFRLSVFTDGRYLEGNNRITLVMAKTGRTTQVVSVHTTAIPAGG